MRTKLIITLERDLPYGDGTNIRHRAQHMTSLEALNSARFPELMLTAIVTDLEQQLPKPEPKPKPN